MNMNLTFPSVNKIKRSKESVPANQSSAIASTNNNTNHQGKPTKKEKAAELTKKQKRILTNMNLPNYHTKSMPTTPQTSCHRSQPPQFPQMPTSLNNYFGAPIPVDVMENVLFRFLYNIPENEKGDRIRICFHIELAHWFYLDFYCPDSGEYPVPNCKKLGFPQFARQVFYKCDFLEKWRPEVDRVVEYFRQYKSSVPTYGVIMLDSSFNYILLIQGYYASKNSWGFPKGKVNEGELPLECAIREALEEVGFDATNHISEKVRPLQSFIGETLVRLYIATDVPMDFQFKPHLRKEIRKISWFSVWDLPKDRYDDAGCARLGLVPSNFYSTLPFIKNICEFIQRERAERIKPRCSLLKHEGKSENSAFQPVIPRASSNQQLSMLLSPNTSTLNLHQQFPPPPTDETPSTSRKCAMENFFKPLNVEPDNDQDQLKSFTGKSFLDHILMKGAISPQKPNNEQRIPRNPAGVIGGETRRTNKEIKQPKPLHASKLVLNVYEAPPEPQQSSPESPQKQPKKTKKVKAAKSPPRTMEVPAANGMAEEGDGDNEIVNMLRASFGKKEHLLVKATTTFDEKRGEEEDVAVPMKGKEKSYLDFVVMHRATPPTLPTTTDEKKRKKEAAPSRALPKMAQMMPTQVLLGGAGKKSTVFTNGFNANLLNHHTNSMPITTPQSSQQSPTQFQQMPSSSDDNFGPPIPEDVMENVLFRFLYNIPENEKGDQIRILSHVEQAYSFYLNFYCRDERPVPNCKKLDFPLFARQVFYKCDFLEKWRPEVDRIVEAKKTEAAKSSPLARESPAANGLPKARDGDNEIVKKEKLLVEMKETTDDENEEEEKEGGMPVKGKLYGKRGQLLLNMNMLRASFAKFFDPSTTSSDEKEEQPAPLPTPDQQGDQIVEASTSVKVGSQHQRGTTRTTTIVAGMEEDSAPPTLPTTSEEKKGKVENAARPLAAPLKMTQLMPTQVLLGGIGKKSMVPIRRSSANFSKHDIKTMPTTSQRQPVAKPMPSSSDDNFGAPIPEDVMENVLFRFLYNIPENEREDQIRIYSYVEQAYSFYLNFYCRDERPVPNCKKLAFPQFARQVFYKCDFLEKWRPEVDRL